MTDRIQKTMNFLKEYLENGTNDDLQYRYFHSLRVASIGQKIARAEGMNEEALIIGCLLHDISYANLVYGEGVWLTHGRESAKIARPFLEALGFEEEVVNEICFGIAIHVDDEADFEGERTALALTIGDCDNIDRFDTYRIYDNLRSQEFEKQSFEEQIAILERMITRLKKYQEIECATQTGTLLWREKIAYQLDFYQRLMKQMTTIIE